MAMVVKLDFPFIAGDEVELKSFIHGFRGAWFRCKINAIRNRGGSIQCAVKYTDFPDEKMKWTNVYEAAPKDPSSGQKPKPRIKELMLRPPFPPFHKESEQPKSLLAQPPSAEVTVVVNDVWRLGDLVDLWCDDCYWSGTIIKLQADDVEVELPGPPIGEGGIYKGVVSDLRPSLNWSQENGWSVPVSQANGQSWCTAHLVQCSPLALSHDDSDQSAGHVGHALGPSSILCIEDGKGSPVNLNAASKMALEWKEPSCSAKNRSCSSASEDTSNSKPNVVRFPRRKSTSEKGRMVVSSDEEIGTEKREDLQNDASSSDGASMEKSTDSLRFRKNHTSQKSKRVVSSDDEEVGNVVRNSEKRDGDGNREREGDDLETDIGEAIMELEEVASKIRWLKDLLCFDLNPPTSKWKFLPNTPTEASDGRNLKGKAVMTDD